MASFSKLSIYRGTQSPKLIVIQRDLFEKIKRRGSIILFLFVYFFSSKRKLVGVPVKERMPTGSMTLWENPEQLLTIIKICKQEDPERKARGKT